MNDLYRYIIVHEIIDPGYFYSIALELYSDAETMLIYGDLEGFYSLINEAQFIGINKNFG